MPQSDRLSRVRNVALATIHYMSEQFGGVPITVNYFAHAPHYTSWQLCVHGTSPKVWLNKHIRIVATKGFGSPKFVNR